MAYDKDAIADGGIGGDGNDTSDDRVFAPDFEGVEVDLLDARGVVVVGATGEGGQAGGVVNAGGDAGDDEVEVGG